MIDRIIRFAVSQRLLVLMAVALMAAAGVYSLTRLPIDAVPDVTNVQVQILTPAPALAALEVERQITFPVESGMSGLPGIDEIRSISRPGLSAVDGRLRRRRRHLLRPPARRRAAAAGARPDPRVGGRARDGTDLDGPRRDLPVRAEGRPGSGYDAMALRTIQDWNVKRQLVGVEGVTEVNSFGGYEKQYEVVVDPAKLQSFKLTLQDVLEAVERNNANVGGATIEHGGEQYLLRGIGLVKSLDDIGRIVVKASEEGVPVYVRDLAEVRMGSAIRPGAVIADGEGEIVAGLALMLKGENSRAVVERVKERVEQIKPTLPKGVELVPFYDRTELVDRTIKTVEHNLLEGALLVIVVLILLLGNWRGALLTATIIPLSMLFAAILMVLFKVSGNLMSLGALDFGLIVDGAVVMVENAVRRRAEAQHEGSREPAERTILDACVEVGRPVVFAVAIIMIVYLPILSLRGIEGKMFVPMALTVIFALTGSLLLSLTYIPAALTFVLRGRVAETESPVIRFAKRWYRPAFGWVRIHRNPTLAAAVLLLVLSLALFPLLGAEFIPRLDEGAIGSEARLLPSVSLPQSIESYSRAERVFKSFPEVTKVITKIGSAELATDPQGVDAGDIIIQLKDRSEWTSASTKEELVEKIAAAVDKQVPEGAFSFSQPIEMRVAELISGARSDIAIKLFGDDLETLSASAERIAKVVSSVRGAEDIRVDQVTGLPQLEVEPRREAIARYGINVADVNELVESIVAGEEAGQVFEGEQRFDLVVKLGEGARSGVRPADVAAVRQLLVSAPSGARIPLAEIADVRLTEGPAQISREGARRVITVGVNVRGRDIGSFVDEARRRIGAEVQLPPGYYVTWGGTVRESRASAGSPLPRRAARANAHLCPALYDVRLDTAGGAHLHGHSLRHRRGRLRPRAQGPAVLDLGGGGIHRALRRGRAQRGRDGELHQPAAGRGALAQGSGRGRGRDAVAPRADDGARRIPGLRPDGNRDLGGR
jgi:cobalt-zinc-cadmium resistance protein CzcA